MTDWHCRIGRVRLRPKLLPPDNKITVLINAGEKGHRLAWDLWHAVHERGANGLAMVVTFPNGDVGTGYSIGHAGSYFTLAGGLSAVHRHVMDELQ